MKASIQFVLSAGALLAAMLSAASPMSTAGSDYEAYLGDIAQHHASNNAILTSLSRPYASALLDPRNAAFHRPVTAAQYRDLPTVQMRIALAVTEKDSAFLAKTLGFLPDEQLKKILSNIEGNRWSAVAAAPSACGNLGRRALLDALDRRDCDLVRELVRGYGEERNFMKYARENRWYEFQQLMDQYDDLRGSTSWQ